MQWVTNEMIALAREVLSEDPDPIAARALADCVCECIGNPDFRFSVAYVEKCEETLRGVWKAVVTKRWAQPEIGVKYKVFDEYDVENLMAPIFKLQQQARQLFNREGP